MKKSGGDRRFKPGGPINRPDNDTLTRLANINDFRLLYDMFFFFFFINLFD